jgi:hypothetical protein
LSGGHPRSIQKLINALIESDWTLPLSNDEDQRLFKKYIDYEIKSLTRDLDDLTKKALETLSIFRQISISTIRVLQSKDLLPREIQALDILACLTKIGLVSKKDNQIFYSDAIVRQFVLAEMKVFDTTRYLHLNSIALEIYNGWINKLLKPNPEASLDPQDLVTLFIREGSYHLCQLLPEVGAIERTAKQLRRYSDYLVTTLGDNKNDPLRKTLLADLISTDNDIQVSLSEHNITVDTLLKLAFSHDERKGGDDLMDAEGKNNILESLVGILDFLRRNAENVLIERWERRNKGRAITPPSFNDNSLSANQIRDDLSQRMDIVFSLGESQASRVYNSDHLLSLLRQATTAQSTVDRFNEALNKPQSDKEKIQLTSERDEYQVRLEHTVDQMADLVSSLYTEN